MTAPAHSDSVRQLDPIGEFRALFARISADSGGPPNDPTAMTLATADASGAPSARIVLLKAVDERGFQFFTNYESRKGRELTANPRAALCWYWSWAETQVRAEGAIDRLTAVESDDYFATRPRGSQIGAWASHQSRELASPAALEAAVSAVEARFAGKTVPRPPHWGGFLLRPQAIEFWHGKVSRLHERRRFRRVEVDGKSTWQFEWLNP
ncbi:MAG: pyridoxamine 5'-phosphate oxidase [Thermoanaerobaculia bacterium]